MSVYTKRYEIVQDLGLYYDAIAPHYGLSELDLPDAWRWSDMSTDDLKRLLRRVRNIHSNLQKVLGDEKVSSISEGDVYFVSDV